MVYESYPWKQDLLRRKRLLLKYNTVEQFEKMRILHIRYWKKPPFTPLLLSES